MTWPCGACRADVDDALDQCWRCGAGRDGSPPPAHWRSERQDAQAISPRELRCLRCGEAMAFAGRRRFHDGSYAREALLGDFFVDREVLDQYVCPGCGKTEFFAPPPR